MASVTLNVAPTISSGTVTVYPQSNWPYRQDFVGAPVGSSVTTGTVGTDGKVTLSGLTAATLYVAYQGSPDRYVQFRVPNAAASSASTTVSSSIGGGRPLVALRNAASGGSGIGNPQGTSRVRHVATKACSDVRLVYGMPFSIESQGVNQMNVKVGLEIASQITGLSSALTTGGAITSLPVLTIGAAIPSGTILTVTSGANTQTWTTTSAASIGAATVAVSSQTPNFAYPAGSAVTMQVVYPVTFAGRATATLDLNGSVISDPIGVELTAGQVFWTRCYGNVPLFNAGGNNAYTTTNASSIVGATVLTSATLIPGAVAGQLVTIDQGGNAETAILASPAVTGSGPYTYTFTTALTKAHASGAVFGQQMLSTLALYSDLGEGFTNGSDLSWSATVIPATSAAGTTTLAASVTAGATKITCVGAVAANTLLIDTGGSGVQETVTVTNVQGTANPYTYYLAAPIANSHSSGVPAVSDLSSVVGIAPVAILADHLPSGSTAKSVVIMASDSIAAGTGNPRLTTSFVTLALDAAQIPYVNTAKAGEAVYQYVQPPVSALRRKLIALGTWAFIEDSTNDLYGAESLAQVQAAFQQACLLAKNRGLKVAATTCLPRTSSTDLWTTANNQSLAGANAARLAYNAWLRAWQSNGLQGTYVDALLDMANVVEVNSSNVLTQDGGFWIASASTPYTADGIHPSSAGHALLAAGLNTTVFT